MRENGKNKNNKKKLNKTKKKKYQHNDNQEIESKTALNNQSSKLPYLENTPRATRAKTLPVLDK